MKPKAVKATIIHDLTARLKGSPNLYVTDFTGVAVQPMTELRRKLRGAGVDYVVVKNTLARRALADAAVEGLDSVLAGPTGIVFAGAEPLVAAKILSAFQKDHETMQLKAGVVDGRRVSGAEIRRLAALPSRPELLAQLGGAMQAPLQSLVGALSGLLYQFVGAVEALRAQRAGA
jgi:large subunit ribosomal protein L10